MSQPNHTQEEETQVEMLVDRYGVRGVLDILAAVCHGKADHVLDAWQDECLSKVWSETGDRIEEFRIARVPGVDNS